MTRGNAAGRFVQKCRLLAAVGASLLVLAMLDGRAIAQQARPPTPEDQIKDYLSRQRQNPQPQAGGATVDVKAPATPPGDNSAATVKFTLKKIVVSKSAVLPAARLNALIAKYVDREITLQDVNELVKEITALYHEVGFKLGFAILPPQTVKDDTLQIVLIEPRLAGVDVKSGYTDPDYLRAQIPLKQGALIDVDALQRALELMRRNSVSGLQLAAHLVPGATQGTSRIVLDVAEGPRNSFTVTSDNEGTIANGLYRQGAIYRNASLFGRDDPLSIGTSISTGSFSAFGIYDRPVGYDGTRVTTQASVSDGAVVGGNFNQLGLTTQGQFLSAEIRHPYILSPNWTVFGTFEGAISNSTTATGPLQTGTAIGRLSTGIRTIYFDPRGSLELNNKLVVLRSDSYDNIGSVYGSFAKYAGSLTSSFKLGDYGLVTEWAWQLTPDHLLPSAEQFSMGGPSTLRAYEQGLFNGDNGFSGRIEVHGRTIAVSQVLGLPAGWLTVQPFVFAEAGAALPYRAVAPIIRREDFASDIGGALDLSIWSGRLTGRLIVAKSLDEVHQLQLDNNPEILLELSTKTDY